jgi:hypothetical protein
MLATTQMRTRNLRPAVFLLLLFPGSARAGMPVFTLDSLVATRVEDISFFIALTLASAAGLRLLWNCAFKPLPQMPRLSYKQALALTFVLGLAMLLVLTMISGARELLTPGAWQKQGNTYKLTSPVMIEQRRARLLALFQVLRAYADGHGGKWPAHEFVPEIPAPIWQAPDEGGTRYVYLGGLGPVDATTVIAFEPSNFGSPRLGVTAEGKIRELSVPEVRVLLGLPALP